MHTICSSPSRVLKSVESFVGVADEWQTHFGILLRWNSLCLALMNGSVVFLGDFVNWEIADIHIRRKLGLKWSSDATKLVPDDAFEEWMLLDLRSSIVCSTIFPKTVTCIAEKAKQQISARSNKDRDDSPSDHVLRLATQNKFIRKVQGLPPIDNLPVRVMSILCTEWWPSNKTFKHDGSHRPPVTEVSIPLVQEDLGGNVVRGTHG